MADLTIPGLGAITPALDDLLELADASASNATGKSTLQQVLALLASSITANANAVAISEALGVYKRKKTSNQSLTGETLEDVTDLTVPILNGHYYQFRADVWFQTTALATGIQLAMAGAGSMKMIVSFQNAAANTVSTTSLITSVTGTAAAQVLTAVPTANTTMVAVMMGSVIASSDTNLKIQAAFETGTTGTTIRAGSTFRVEDFGT